MPGTNTALFLLSTLLASAPLQAQAPPKGEPGHGREIYVRYGCYACHGYQGQGSNAGPRIAPDPFPYAAFAVQLRQPRQRMPAYTIATVSDRDVADLYAFLLTIPKAKAVTDIPLLAGQGEPR